MQKIDLGMEMLNLSAKIDLGMGMLNSNVKMTRNKSICVWRVAPLRSMTALVIFCMEKMWEKTMVGRV